jgi:subtilisin-like proprotein convertase family protein
MSRQQAHRTAPPTARPVSRRRASALRLERLEDRCVPASISGTVFHDWDGDGARGAAAEEPALAGRVAYLDLNHNGARDVMPPRTVASANVPRAIPDLGAVTSTLSVSGGGQVLDVDVTLTASNTYDFDLDVYLVGPTGVRVELFTGVGLAGTTFYGTTLDDEAAGPITAGTAPFTGRYRPEGSLAAFDGLTAGGTWALEVRDTGQGYTGTLHSWSLTLTTTTEPFTTTDAAGAYAFTDLAAGSYTVRTVAPDGWAGTGSASHDVTLGYPVAAAAGRDLGQARTGAVYGRLFNDLDRDGARDAGEPALAGATVSVRPQSGAVTNVAADAAGGYVVGLPPGTFTVTPFPAGWTATTPAAGSYAVNLAAGGTAFGRDFGLGGNGRAPTATVSVTPNPRNDAVNSILVLFSEAVTGLDLADLRLSRDGTLIPLTAAQTLTSGPDRSFWFLGNLASLTGVNGAYTVRMVAAGTGVTDLEGNALAADVVGSWVKETTPPAASIAPVSPDPRRTPVDSLTVAFSEAVTGFDRADLRLTRDGTSAPLTAAQTLTSPDFGRTWTLGNLAPLTAAEGAYELRLVAAGSGVADAAGNPLTGDAAVTWRMDATPPVVSLPPVSPDPRRTPVDSLTIAFTEPVTGLGKQSLSLRHGSDIHPLPLAGATLTTADGGRTWTLGNLAARTAADGTYTLRVSASSDIADAAGNPLAADVSGSWVMDTIRPSAQFTPVSPDPHHGPVDAVTVTFSEPVAGFGLADLRLSRGGPDLLTAAQTLTTADGGRTWVLGNLAGLTAADGHYRLTLDAAPSGVTDLAGNPLRNVNDEAWRMDALPVATLSPVSPDPRRTPVDVLTVTFTEPVRGFDPADLRLSRDSAPVPLTGATLTTADGGRTWTLANLADLTTADGDYTLTLAAAGVADATGNPLAADAARTWRMDATRPTGQFTPISPDPRRTPVDAIPIAFSEPVTGLDLTNLDLRRDYGPDLLTAAQTLTTPDGGRTWVLGNLAGLTAADGTYLVVLHHAGYDITDAAGNPLDIVRAKAWQMDATAPRLLEMTRLDNNPIYRPQVGYQVTFSESVTGLTAANFGLTTVGLAQASVTAVTGGGATWTVTVGGIAVDGSANGSLALRLVSPAGVTDPAGNPLATSSFDGPAYDIDASSPDVQSVVVNDGAEQRSLVTRLMVTFSEVVVLPADPAEAFRLLGPAGPVGLHVSTAEVGGRTVATLTFAGGGSLADGRYTLTILSDQFRDRAGNRMEDDRTDTFHRLYGDVTGDGTVNGADFNPFRLAFGAGAGTPNYRADFDVNGDGVINGADFNEFRTRFGLSI